MKHKIVVKQVYQVYPGLLRSKRLTYSLDFDSIEINNPSLDSNHNETWTKNNSHYIGPSFVQ